MTTRTKYRGLNSVSILLSTILSILITYKIAKFGCTDTLGIIISVIGIVALATLAVVIISNYEKIRFIRTDEAMSEGMKSLKINNILLIAILTLILII